jgi:hypothetical protein
MQAPDNAPAPALTAAQIYLQLQGLPEDLPGDRTHPELGEAWQRTRVNLQRGGVQIHLSKEYGAVTCPVCGSGLKWNCMRRGWAECQNGMMVSRTPDKSYVCRWRGAPVVRDPEDNILILMPREAPSDLYPTPEDFPGVTFRPPGGQEP